ncbi:UNVERIFIED_CONTAM: hypothetical protein K2H54_031183 [Gekko kuhli]
MADETTLWIRALEAEDNGVLRAQVLFATDEIHKQTFRLSVFEPVPDPQLRHQLVSKTAEGCNVTLQCLASEKGPFTISWKGGNQLSVLEEHSGWYRLSAEGTELHLSWWPNSSDSTLTCLLSNPVDQKSASFDLLSICSSGVAGLVFYLWKKWLSQRALALAMSKKAGQPQYAELRKRSPPEGNENQVKSPHLCRVSFETEVVPSSPHHSRG